MAWMRSLLFAALLPLAACEQITGLRVDPDAPANLTYQLIPSGDPSAPTSVLLIWDFPPSGRANAFNVYGRPNGRQWQLRATTTSPTFHDFGAPDDQYYVASVDIDNREIAESNVVTIQFQTALPAPTGLTSISLNRAIQLQWSSNAADASSSFDHYRVYSTPYDAVRGVCTAAWVTEGTTVADAFLAANLSNGVSRCFAVSAVTHDGHESVSSDARLDTPRPDARNTLVYARAVRADSAGFIFADSVTHANGVVTSAARADADFTVEQHADGSLWLAPARAGVTLLRYAPTRVGDLTDVDRAPSSGYASQPLEAVAGMAYVFRVQEPDGVHFAALRVAFSGGSYVVIDWAYQTAPGNAELNRVPSSLQ
jgi:hypothetical protein